MRKVWTVEAVFYILTSVESESEKEARVKAKRELHELAGFIRPYCDALDVELGNVEEEEVD